MTSLGKDESLDSIASVGEQDVVEFDGEFVRESVPCIVLFSRFIKFHTLFSLISVALGVNYIGG